MQANTGNILVSVDPSQRDEMLLGDTKIRTAHKYSESFRQKNASLCRVIQGVRGIPVGTWLVCHYLTFDDESPSRIYDNVYSIPVNEMIIGRLDEDGNLTAMCGNILVDEIKQTSFLALPGDLVKDRINQGIVAQTIGKYKRGMHIFWLNYSNYRVLWRWKDREHEATKIEINEIVGFLKKE